MRSPSASTPDAKKLASGVSMSRGRFMWVMKRGPLIAKTNPSGTASRHARQMSGDCSE